MAYMDSKFIQLELDYEFGKISLVHIIFFARLVYSL